MKAFILYRPQSEFARRAEEYVHDFQATRGKSIDLIDIDSVEGVAQVELYDVVDSPALLITRENGELINQWQGIESFPVMNELATQLAL
jgi:hypothetical protein